MKIRGTNLDKKLKLKFWERYWAGRGAWSPLYFSSLLLKLFFVYNNDDHIYKLTIRH